MPLTSWINPFPTEDIPSASRKLTPRQAWKERKKMDDMLRAAAQTGLGWFGVMFATRLAVHGMSGRSEEKDLKAKLRTYATARAPTMSFKESAETQNVPLNPVRKLLKAFTRTDKSALQIAAALASSSVGATLGWQIADKLVERQKAKKVQKSISSNSSALDRLLTDEYMRTRGLGKYSAEERDPHTSWLQGLKTIYPVYALGLIFLAYKLAKDTMDSTDPERQKIKSLKDYARQKALVENPPILIDSLGLPDMEGGLRAGKAKVSGKVDLPNRRSPLLEI